MSNLLFYICDMRPAWNYRPYISFWRPDNAGYCYPLSWAGKYDLARILSAPDYYYQRNSRSYTQFAIPCAAVDAVAGRPMPGTIDGDTGPVIIMSKATRANLRAAIFVLPTGVGRGPLAEVGKCAS